MQKHYAYFSAAIRDGAKLRPQAFHAFAHEGGTCALGAGVDAMGVLDEFDPFLGKVVYDAFRYMDRLATCPECSIHRSIYNVILHLNDDCLWTRERIADWLYAEEEKLGFVTVVETQDTCDTRDNDLSLDSPASLPEEVFV